MTPIRLVRLAELVRDASGATGHRATLSVGDLSVHAIERGDGFKWLRPGWYDCVMARWTTKAGGRTRAIRVLGDYSAGWIYIHPANWPHQLTGCIAPGLTRIATGVGESRDAMGEIFDALGGWREGAAVALEVIGSLGAKHE